MAPLSHNVIGKTNPSTGETFGFSYDNKNRLISAQDTTASGVQMRATYVYDALGQRIEKDVWTQSGGSTTTIRFAYDNGEIWADLTLLNALQTRYIRGEQVLELLAQMASGVAAWVLADRMGSIRNVVDNTGVVIDAITYDGYGNVVNETSPAGGGQYKAFAYRYDSETGLYRPDPSTGRYYNPLTGLWLSRDPISSGARYANLYWYVANQPLALIDPNGEDFIAVADRKVDWKLLGIKPFSHYSLEYWQSTANPKCGQQLNENEVKKFARDTKAKRVSGVELLAENEWDAYAWPRGALAKKVYVERPVLVSYIRYDDNGINILPIMEGTADQVKAKWDLIIQQAKLYAYAEQPGYNKSPVGKGFKNWPNSMYVASNKKNNSNTFVRFIVKAVGLTMVEMKGLHPGLDSPEAYHVAWETDFIFFDIYPPFRHGLKGADKPPKPTTPPKMRE